MAPIEPDLTNSNTTALLAGGTYLGATISILAVLGYRVFYRAYVSLPPSQSVRNVQHSRRNYEAIFAGLAAISLLTAIYYGFNFLLLSYQIWAYERGEVFPTGIFTEEGLLSSKGPKLLLGRWFRDTDLTGELWEIAMEKTRRRWWTNQLILSTTAWSLYVSVKGRAHAIPHLLAFVLLAPFVSLSFAMNLFFLAILMTPLPIPEDATAVVSTRSHSRKSSKKIRSVAEITATSADSFLGRISAIQDRFIPPKPLDWTPHPLISLIPLLLSLVHTVLLSFASNTTSFHFLLNLLFLDILLPIALPVLIPERFGSPSAARHHHTASLTTFSVLSVAVQVFTTIIAVMYNDPGAHRHRHSVLFFKRNDDRSQFERTTTALGRIFGAINDHPAVGRIGSDVLLASISLATWAAVRGIEPSHILRAAGWATKAEIKAVKEMTNRVTGQAQNLITDAEEDVVGVPSPKRGKRKAITAAADDEGTSEKLSAEGTYQGDDTGVVKADEVNEEVELESGALAWGMMVIGGLTCGLSGVLGSDIGL